MISRDKCLEWAKEAGFAVPENRNLQCWEQWVDTIYLETLVDLACKEGQKDMRERAAKLVVEQYTGFAASVAVDQINALEIK